MDTNQIAEMKQSETSLRSYSKVDDEKNCKRTPSTNTSSTNMIQPAPSTNSNTDGVTKPSKPAYEIMKPGDLAWARLGSAPFWPCIIARDLDFKKDSNSTHDTGKEYLVQVTKI